MPLSPAKPRTPLNERSIRCHGYRRCDGLWELEASLVDTRACASDTPFRQPVQSGEPYHQMHVRIAFDETRTLREVEVAIDSHPFPECLSVLPNFQRLVGMQIGAGFTRELQARISGEAGCTHVASLLGNMANVAFQTLSAGMDWDDRTAISRVFGVDRESGTPPPFIGSCGGYALDGGMVRRVYPEFYRPRAEPDS